MAPPSVLEQCFDEVTGRAPLALGRCLEHVISKLQEAEASTVRSDERTELRQAWRELQARKAEWCQTYPAELRAAFRSTVDQTRPAAPAWQTTGGGPLDQLALVGHAEIVQSIETSRLIEELMPRVERPASELDALISTALGLPRVQPDLNPVRPEVFAQTLRTLVGRSQLKSAAAPLWMKYLADPLAAELEELYGLLVRQLKAAHVQAAGFGPARTHSGRPGAHGSRSRGSPPAEGSPDRAPRPSMYASFTSEQIGNSLLREFLLDGASGAPPLTDSYYAGVERELAALNDARSARLAEAPPSLPPGYRELPPVDRPARPIGVQSTLSSEVWGQYRHSLERSLIRSRLRRDASEISQVLGLELVRQMVNQVAQDPRLLPPVREAIVALEPALLRLAMVDPRFFSDEHHAGRLLIERVAQRSFKYNDEFSSEFEAFFADVSRIFHGLNQREIDSTEPFEAASSELEALWQQQEQQDEKPRSKAVSAMVFAELRQAEAGQIAWELSTRADLQAVPAVVQDFVFGPWALVLAHARLTDRESQADPHGYRAVIDDLLWSVNREVTLRRPAELFERVPQLLARLREGLRLIGQAPHAHEFFFQELMKLHHPVLKLRRAKSRRDARDSGLAPLDLVDSAPVPPEPPAPLPKPPAGDADPEQPWMSEQELNAAGFHETIPTDLGELLPLVDPGAAAKEAATKAAAAPAAAPPDPAAILAQLREGDWVDLYSTRRWLRAKLVWASAKATLFMFISHGGRPHSMTRRVCERLIRQRSLRPVQAHSVVAQALDALESQPRVL